jgi:hypothetical protein
MLPKIRNISIPVCLAVLFLLPHELFAMSAREILEQVLKQNFGDSFRVAVSINTFKAKKLVSSKSLWFVGQTQGGRTSIFVDLEEPPESKGLRFLFFLEREKQPEAFMYVPTADKVMPFALDDQSADIGGTGLTMDDVQAFAPQEGQQETVVKEEDVDGRACYRIRISSQETKGERLVWVSKDGFNIVKSQEVDADGKVKRTFRVSEFFRSEKGREYPRVEEITIPGKDVRIEVRQEHGLFGIQIPPELFDPETFGKFHWKM